MTPSLILLNLAGIAIIAFIPWWFWFYKPKASQLADSSSSIIVEDGVYQPARIRIAANKPTTLEFLRKDPSDCASVVVFGETGVAQNLEINQATSVDLPPLAAGEYPFHCQMQMYRGTLVVE